MLETVFNTQDIKILRSISRLANANNCSIYLIGGVVRDILLGRKPKDIDIVVVGDAINLATALKNEVMGKIIKCQPEMRTAQIEFTKDMVIDFASTRKEVYGERKGIPIASHFGCPLKIDVMRRDFTVNAMAISLNSLNFGSIVDFVDGQSDLAKKELKILHGKSFEDDPTRIIRAFKFSHRLGFHLEEQAQQLQDIYLLTRDFNVVVSPARIKKEVFEIFEQNSVPLVQDFVDKEIYKVVAKTINDIKISKIAEIIEEIDITKEIPFIYFASLFFNKENEGMFAQYNLTKNQLKMIEELKFSNKFGNKLSDLELYRYYSNRTKESLALELIVEDNDNIRKYLNELKDVKINITGEDLLLMGVPNTINYSTIFDKVMTEKVKGNLPDKSSELKFVRKLIINHEV